MLVTTFSAYGKDLLLIAARWNIAQQHKPNRKGTADRPRADRAGEATKRSLRRLRQLV